MKRALIFGGAGQDGRLLRDLLERREYEVHSIVRQARSMPHELLNVYEADISDGEAALDLMNLIRPNEIYNLAAASSVAESWSDPLRSVQVNTVGTLTVLEALKRSTVAATARIYQASSSEMFGQPSESPQTEATAFRPVSPYAASKLAAHHLVGTYRAAHGIHASCGILYNHESHLRPTRFVTRKITQGVARISRGVQQEITLGPLDVERDWGYAGDYVRAMWAMLQLEDPSDFVVATGQARPLSEFVRIAFACVGIECWEPYIRIDESLARPREVARLVGDATKARDFLGWTPRVGFAEMIERMVDNDLQTLSP